ncbi:hypothetical protein SDC9_201928 [bioreactor metagenome]|uniref:Uncharacterized protein n=1 Tax=bioreactor metagenome TaxID=1076179 RepID=A0A645IS95_9ZZZZ
MGFLGVFPEIRLVQDAHLWNPVGEHRIRRSGDVDIARHGEFDSVALAAQGSAGHNLKVDLVVGRRGDLFGDFLRAFVVV